MKRIIIRLDDICPDMNYGNFSRIKEMLLFYNIKPLIGVIPDNRDKKLQIARAKSIILEDNIIWEEIKTLQDRYGWEVALHGFDHVYETKNGGILRVNKKSEFAGVDVQKQESKIQAGINTLTARGLNCISFMAPSHSFDHNTLNILSKMGLNTVSDGRGVFPYRLDNCILMPVPYSMFLQLPLGIYTVCLHPNTMTDKEFHRLEVFFQKERKHIIPFSEGLMLYQIHKNVLMSIINIVFNIIMIAAVKGTSILSHFKRGNR